MKIAVLPGDGIGKDVTEVAMPVFDKLNVNTELIYGDIGWEFWKKEGNPVPIRTWKLMDECDAILIGAVTSKTMREAEKELANNLKGNDLKYVSPVIQLRQKLKLFANIRPSYSIKNNKVQISDNFDMVVIRENTEGLYSGLDFSPIPDDLYSFIQNAKPKSAAWKIENPKDGAISCRVITRFGIKRLLRFAFELARIKKVNKITWTDKPNALRQSGQFSLDILEEIASEYPEITYEVKNVDAVAMWMVRRPEQFGIIVCENQFGDILSDLSAGIMGGLGLAASANIGIEKSYFEPVHGSAPKYEGKNVVNPSAMFLTISLLLENNKYYIEAKRLREAVEQVISEGKKITRDLGGNASTTEMAKAIIERC